MFGEYGESGEIGVTTDTGILHIDSNTIGSSARSRGISVFIDTLSHTTGVYTLSFDVSNWTDGNGSLDFTLLEGAGLDTGFLDVDHGQNNDMTTETCFTYQMSLSRSLR